MRLQTNPPKPHLISIKRKENKTGRQQLPTEVQVQRVTIIQTDKHTQLVYKHNSMGSMRDSPLPLPFRLYPVALARFMTAKKRIQSRSRSTKGIRLPLPAKVIAKQQDKKSASLYYCVTPLVCHFAFSHLKTVASICRWGVNNSSGYKSHW